MACVKISIFFILNPSHLINFITFALRFYQARMAKLVDALVSGTSDRKVVQVRVLFRAPNKQNNPDNFHGFWVVFLFPASKEDFP